VNDKKEKENESHDQSVNNIVRISFGFYPGPYQTKNTCNKEPKWETRKQD
jgi:hypothetical protein